MEEVFRGIVKALSQHFPIYDLISGLVFKVDFERLLVDLKGLVTFFSNGNFVLEFGSDVSDFDTILTCLVAAYVGHELYLCEENSLMVDEIFNALKSSNLPYSRKTVSNRLSDLARMNLALRVAKGKYRTTEMGIRYFLKKSMPAIRSIMEGKRC